MSAEYLVCVDAGRFATDPDTPLADGDVVLVMGADAGG